VVCGSAFGWFLAAAHPPATDLAEAPADSVARITTKAVWNPTADELSNIRRKCTEGDPPQHEACFLDAMKTAGASAEATAFVKDFAPNGLAYVRAFRDTGRVDIAYIEYLFRANDLDGVLLVNGTPPIIDVDKFLSQEDLRKNADYAALLQKYPNTNVFPADRYHTEQPVATSSANKGQEFQVEYLLQDGCHACGRIGTVIAGFDFDDSGRFVQIRVLKVRPGGDADYDRPILERRPDPK
jgi:hypothetical protein